MNPMKMFWGFIVAGIGILLLGNNIGWWDLNFWSILWLMWPVIIIVLGVRFLVSNDFLFVLIAFLLIVGAGYLAIERPSEVFNKIIGTEDVVSENVSDSFDRDSIKKLNLKIDLGASKVNIGSIGQADTDHLYEISTSNYQKLDRERTDIEGEANITIDEEFFPRIYLPRTNTKREFNGKISTLLPVNLDIQTGASLLDLDLSKLTLTKMKLDTGAIKGNIIFGKVAEILDVKISAGASNITLNIPDGTGLRFKNQSALTSTGLENKLELVKNSDGTYETKDYEASKNKINIEVSSGASNIELKSY